jgi:two-component system response regulator PilR (NtrC family)
VLNRLATTLGVSEPSLTRAAQAALLSYRFPGNVRELENVLERALTLCADNEIDVDDLQLRAAPDDDEAEALEVDGSLGSQLEHIERDAIVKALEQTRYNKTAAAKLLGISFRALRYRIKKLEIES